MDIELNTGGRERGQNQVGDVQEDEQRYFSSPNVDDIHIADFWQYCHSLIINNTNIILISLANTK